MKIAIKFSEETSYKYCADADMNKYTVQAAEDYVNVGVRHMGYVSCETLMNLLGVRMNLQYLTCGWLTGDICQISIREYDGYLILETNCREDIRS